MAYSGELDRQKQAADVMETVLADHGIDLIHVIGPETEHKIHEDSKVQIERRMGRLAQSASPELPDHVELTTYTLRYNQMHWVRLLGIEKHWKESSVRASIQSGGNESTVFVDTHGVTAMQLRFDAGQWRHAFPCSPEIQIDGTTLAGPPVRSDRSWTVDLVRSDQGWNLGTAKPDELKKRPGLQGPIDDAFLDAFLFVTPTLKSTDPAFQSWSEEESAHAMLHWTKHFRGDVKQVEDQELTDVHIANNNLVLFGDPTSNRLIARIVDQLPVVWTANAIRLGDQEFPRAGHAVLMIYPNPLNADRYIVLNSGFTFREYDYLNNARQTPKLPDWAIIDITDGATYRDPGKVRAAGFFDESWRP